MNHLQFRDFVSGQRWTFAKTYSQKCPHEYIVKARVDKGQFESAVHFIRVAGFEAFYFKRKGLYYICGDHYYWTMGAPIAETTVINRAIYGDYILERKRWIWAGGVQR